MKYNLIIILITFLITSCSTMTFKKGKLKKTQEIAYKCYRDEELFYVIKSDDHYKLGNKIYVTEEQFKLFDKINPKDKEEYLLYLQKSGLMRSVYKFNSVEIDLDEEMNYRYKRPVINLKD